MSSADAHFQDVDSGNMNTIAAFLDRYVTFRSAPPELEREFKLATLDISNRWTRRFLLLFSAGVVLFWPTDFLLFRNEPLVMDAFARWRSAFFLLAIILWVILGFDGVRQRRTVSYALLAFTSVVTTLIGGSAIARVGGLEIPLFYTIYCFAGVAAIVVMPLGARAGLIFLMTFGHCVGFFLTRPEALHHPFLPTILIVLVVSDMSYCAIGHALYLLIRQGFYQQRALEAQRLELSEARARSDRLLLSILPAPIAERLQRDEYPIASSHPEVSVLFADIVGFTRLSDQVGAEEVVAFLDRLFLAFDLLVQSLNLEKIKTIGDAYMVVGGLPTARADHAHAVARLALEMQRIAREIKRPDGEGVELRMGICSGPVVAGVIGGHKFFYDLWGDTVNTASRMESQGLPGTIQVADATYQLLKDAFEFEDRGELEVKGKGKMRTWWLVRERIRISDAVKVMRLVEGER